MKSDQKIPDILTQIPLYRHGTITSKPWNEDFFIEFDFLKNESLFSISEITTQAAYTKLKDFYHDFSDYLIKNKKTEDIKKILEQISLEDLPDSFLYKSALYLYSVGEIAQTKKLTEYLIDFAFKYSSYEDLIQLKEMVEEVPIIDESRFYYYLLTSRFDSLVDFYEKIYYKFFLRNKIDEAYLARFTIVKEKIKYLFEDYRFQLIIQDIELIENIKITLATDLPLPFQGKKNILVYSVIAKSVSTVFFQTTIIYLHYSQRENIIKKILKYKKTREVIVQNKNNRMISFLKEIYLDAPLKQTVPSEIKPPEMHTLDIGLINLFKNYPAETDEELTKIYRLSVDFLSEDLELRNLIENAQYDRAVKYLDHKSSNRNQVLKASLLMKLKKYSELIDLLESIQTEDVDEVKEILYLQAMAYQKLKMNELAKDLFRKLHSLDPNYKLANVKIHEI